MTNTIGASNQDHFNELLTKFNKENPIALYLGMKLSFTKTGNAIIEMPFNPNLNHSYGAIHGGIYAILLDSVGAQTSAAIHEPQSWIATSELSIHFLLPSLRTSLRAEGTLLRSGTRQDVVEMHLYNEKEQLVGHGIGTFIAITKENQALYEP
jgi:acyl-CoA thioesterase